MMLFRKKQTVRLSGRLKSTKQRTRVSRLLVVTYIIESSVPLLILVRFVYTS